MGVDGGSSRSVPRGRGGDRGGPVARGGGDGAHGQGADARLEARAVAHPHTHTPSGAYTPPLSIQRPPPFFSLAGSVVTPPLEHIDRLCVRLRRSYILVHNPNLQKKPVSLAFYGTTVFWLIINFFGTGDV